MFFLTEGWILSSSYFIQVYLGWSQEKDFWLFNRVYSCLFWSRLIFCGFLAYYWYPSARKLKMMSLHQTHKNRKKRWALWLYYTLDTIEIILKYSSFMFEFSNLDILSLAQLIFSVMTSCNTILLYVKVKCDAVQSA